MPQETAGTSASPTPVESPQTGTAVAEKPDPQVGVPRLWNVVLLDDDHHTYDYVIEMVCRLFRRSPDEAYTIARTVDRAGRAVCMTTHKELAELKQDQIHSFGADPLMSTSRGSMSAVIEPATTPDDSHNADNGAGGPENNEAGSNAGGAGSTGAN